jgi:hypothetical protein
MNQKVQIASNLSIFGKTVFFYKQVLDFHCPSKILCQTSGRQNHWSLMRTYIKVPPITAESVLHRIMCFPLWCLAAGMPAMRSAVRLGGAGADARGGLLPRGLPVRTVRPRPSGSPIHPESVIIPVLWAREVRIRP